MAESAPKRHLFNDDIELTQGHVIKINGVTVVTESGGAQGNISIGGNTISSINTDGPIILNPNGDGHVQLNKDTRIVAGVPFKLQNIAGDREGFIFDANSGNLRCMLHDDIGSNPAFQFGYYTTNSSSQAWNSCVNVHLPGYIDIKKPSGSVIPSAGVYVEGLQVLKERQSAVPDTNASSVIPNISSGSTAVETQNGFADLQALRNAVNDLRASFETLRVNVNTALARLRTHGLIAT